MTPAPHLCRLTLALYLSLGVLACSEPAGQGAPAPAPGEARIFGPAERAAARSLSIGNRSALELETDPYRQAVRCARAIASVEAIVRSSGALDPEMATAFVAARKVYLERSEALAPPADAELRSDENAASPTRAEESRIAVACLQSLQAAGTRL